MNWYIAKIVFNISAENTVHKPQFDEQLRLITAENAEEAFIKARTIGIREEDSFINDHHNKVNWEFINVTEIIRINTLEDGTELYSTIYETDEAQAYVHCIHQKAIFLRLSAKLVI
jgi:hypothetical protein